MACYRRIGERLDEGISVVLMIKFSLLTCLFYIGLSLVLEVVALVFASFREDLLIGATGWRLGALFATVWIVSFQLASHFFFRR
jgi:hypothetical protein